MESIVLNINEVFFSIQGEGIHIGVPTIFIRFATCNLRCNWCDTSYAYEQGKEFNTQGILMELGKYKCKTVCITGGEPLHQKEECLKLITWLLRNKYKVILETNGSLDINDVIGEVKTYFKFQPLSDLCISMDWKLQSSGEYDQMYKLNLQYLRSVDQLKFVVADAEDYNEAKEIINNLPKYKFGRPEVIIQLAVNIEEVGNAAYLKSLKNLTEVVIKDELQVRVLPQLHKLLWGNKKSV